MDIFSYIDSLELDDRKIKLTMSDEQIILW